MGTPKEIEAKVRSAVESPIAREGFELVDVQSVIEHGRKIVRLFIDTVPPGTSQKGVTVDDCAIVSRLVGDILDVENAVDGEYTLEVSSPGLFRPLTKPEHFDRVVGQRVRLKTFEKQDGRKVFIGTLKERKGEAVTVEIDGTPFVVDLGKVARANLEPLL